MGGWTILIWAGVCAAGVLTYLTLVSHEIGRARFRLEKIERREKHASRHRQGASENDVELDQDGVFHAEAM